MKVPALAFLAAASAISTTAAAPFQLQLRDWTDPGDGPPALRVRDVEWEPAKTAVVVCDMWDAHHCKRAVDRGLEIAPRMDALLKHVRDAGGLIIHSPSSCMDFYGDHPARERARAAPTAPDLPEGIDSWLHWIDEREEAAGYPIDHSDGGEDDGPEEHAAWAAELESRGLDPRAPWTRQTPALTVDPDRDAITDSGVENWNLLRAHGIEHVLMVGVHTNMCVLGRPFGLRQLAKNSVDVALVRDLTDTMYNPEMPPRVSHFAGTDLVIKHVETYVCPTVSSEQILGGQPLRFAADDRPELLFLIGEREYQTEETLPRFAADHLTPSYRCRFLFAGDGSNDFGDIAGALETADAVFVSVRRRTPKEADIAALRAYVAAGRPVIGIRTASHAFSIKGGTPPAGHAAWEDFDSRVFGGNYTGHHGNALATRALGLGPRTGTDFPTGGSLYQVLPLADAAETWFEGAAEGIGQRQPVAWTFTRADGGRSFYTSLGHIDDFARPEFSDLLRDGIRWVLQSPGDKAQPAPAPAAEGARAAPPPPDASRDALRVPEDLEVDLVLSEPSIAQPLHLSFDVRGRLWVVEYRQYPDPAGLVELSRDKVWRVAYDRVPPPPPHAEGSPFRGRDRISIHEDSDGDGAFDTHTVFADGLNVATSVAHDDGGVWVTNPPYLLFFPDRDGDDVPDGAPEVHLAGFGLEDTHSVANSLTWGPDGWLYGANGSTVSAAVYRPGLDDPAAARAVMGQHIWRYQPSTRTHEVFAEGGGNAFGVAVDSAARVFSGHNGGDTRGFHYQQGAYYQKTWGKHGSLTNPHAYGFLPPMANARVARFTHQFLFYEGDALPARYRGKLWGVDVLHSNLVLSERVPDGSTFRTRDIERVVQSDDAWFKPVMVAEGPDGAIYIADWCDAQVNHYKNHEGDIDHHHGRVFRVRAKGQPAGRIRADWKAGPHRWDGHKLPLAAQIRTTVDRAVAGASRPQSPPAGGTSRGIGVPPMSVPGASRPEADRSKAPDDPKSLHPWLIDLAKNTDDIEALAQLACSARRVGAETGLELAASLTRRDELADDPCLPLLLWWAVEQHIDAAPETALAPFGDSTFWRHRIARETVAPRLMRRLAADQSEAGYARCETLLAVAPDPGAKALLVRGFLDALAGRPAPPLPASLLAALRDAGGELPPALRLRLGEEGAAAAAFTRLADTGAPDAERAELAAALAETRPEGYAATLIATLRDQATAEPVRVAIVAALAPDAAANREVESSIAAQLAGGPSSLRTAAAHALASHPDTARRMLEAAGGGEFQLDRDDIALIETLRAHRGLGAILDRSGQQDPKPPASATARLRAVATSGGGDPKRGESVFATRCGACHKMFGAGGEIGPDLTSYQRTDTDALLLAITDPSAEIREGFEHTVVKLRSGAVHSGFRTDESPGALTLREISGATRTLPKAEVESVRASPASLMPPGLLDGLDDAALRDLFAFLRSTTPPY